MLKIHIMFKAEMGSNAIPELKKMFVRQGKNTDVEIKKNFDTKKIKHDDITDGFDWSVRNGFDVTSEDPIAAISTNNEGDTKFSKESKATLHAYSDKGIGKVIVTAKGFTVDIRSNLRRHTYCLHRQSCNFESG